MTTFEELEAAWKEQSTRLDRIDLTLANQVHRQNAARIKAPLRGLIVSLWLEIVLTAVGMLLMGGFLADHIRQFRFVWPAALMDVWLAGALIIAIRQLIAARGIEFDEPVAGVQQHLARLRILRLRYFRWLFFSGQIVWWVPFLIISLRMVFGIDAHRFLAPTFIAINAIVGLAVVPILAIGLRSIRSAAGQSWYQRLADVIAGRSLAEARQQADILSEFLR
ncbi:hypothetical protein ACFQBQ_16860 [Granulicella cerasi]|uniref:Serine/threonine protein kinase n=1 Tax=Granulicella cerasi TaxID=741063 RepID=A0ABW1ZFM2_9BACT|nr:hypothetical protein [Granulicella cerasi]